MYCIYLYAPKPSFSDATLLSQECTWEGQIRSIYLKMQTKENQHLTINFFQNWVLDRLNFVFQAIAFQKSTCHEARKSSTQGNANQKLKNHFLS